MYIHICIKDKKTGRGYSFRSPPLWKRLADKNHVGGEREFVADEWQGERDRASERITSAIIRAEAAKGKTRRSIFHIFSLPSYPNSLSLSLAKFISFYFAWRYLYTATVAVTSLFFSLFLNRRGRAQTPRCMYIAFYRAGIDASFVSLIQRNVFVDYIAFDAWRGGESGGLPQMHIVERRKVWVM